MSQHQGSALVEVATSPGRPGLPPSTSISPADAIGLPGQSREAARRRASRVRTHAIELARELVTSSQGRRWWRRLYTAPEGSLVGGDPRRRRFDGWLPRLIAVRDQTTSAMLPSGMWTTSSAGATVAPPLSRMAAAPAPATTTPAICRGGRSPCFAGAAHRPTHDPAHHADRTPLPQPSAGPAMSIRPKLSFGGRPPAFRAAAEPRGCGAR